MLFTSVLTGVAALASSAKAAAVPSTPPAATNTIESDPYIGDLRTFTQENCSLDNQGVGTMTHSMTGGCNVYAEAFSSIYIHLNPGWIFRAHATPNCTDNGTIIALTQAGSASTIVCNNQTIPWVAYSVDALQPGEIIPHW
ncbi:hypothetical protein M426DRAFT_110044 [Hypoxylon sp. CI-4A]|nr:hypothetical protein M426DRAFT_110044 [Hypoxylon sp. CI-4A]